MQNKNVLMTGATSGLGKELAKQLARDGAQLYVIARSDQKAQQLCDEVISEGGLKPKVFKADLLSLQETKRAAQQFMQAGVPLHVLMNNAGGVFSKKEDTPEGFDKIMALNYFSLVLLTQTLLPVLKETGKICDDVRVVNTASQAHQLAWPGLNLDVIKGKKKHSSFIQYAHAKMANIMYTKKLSQQLKADNVTVNCFHPGVVYTNFGKDSTMTALSFKLMSKFLLTPKQGSETGVYLACSPEVSNMTGFNFFKKKKLKPMGFALNTEKIDTLWSETQSLLADFT